MNRALLASIAAGLSAGAMAMPLGLRLAVWNAENFGDGDTAELVVADDKTFAEGETVPESVKIVPGSRIAIDAETLAALGDDWATAKPADSEQKTEYFKVSKVTRQDGLIVLEAILDETAIELEETVEELVGDTAMAAIGEAEEGASINLPLVNAKPGLFYGIVAVGDLTQMNAAANDVTLKRITAGDKSLSVTKPAGNAVFFKVIVSDRPK